MPPNKKLERIAKKLLLYLFGGLTLMVILIVVFSDDSVATENASEDKVKPVKQEIIEYTPCDCADISYKVAKNGGVDAASAVDNDKLEKCNELMGSTSFMSKAKACPSYLKLMNLYKF
jgi:hypothetical protein